MDSCRNHHNTVPSPESGRAPSLSPAITTNWWLPPRALLRDLVPPVLPRGEAERTGLTHCWGQLASNELLSCLHRAASSALSSRQRQYRSRALQHTCLSFMVGAAIPAGLPGLAYNPGLRRGGPELCSSARPPEEQPTWASARRSSAPGPPSRPASPRTTQGNAPPGKQQLTRVDPSWPQCSTLKGGTSGCVFRLWWARLLGVTDRHRPRPSSRSGRGWSGGIEGGRRGPSRGRRPPAREHGLPAKFGQVGQAQVGQACRPDPSSLPCFGCFERSV